MGIGTSRKGIRILLALLERVGGDGVVGGVGPLDGKLREAKAIAKRVARLARVVLVWRDSGDATQARQQTIRFSIEASTSASKVHAQVMLRRDMSLIGRLVKSCRYAVVVSLPAGAAPWWFSSVCMIASPPICPG